MARRHRRPLFGLVALGFTLLTVPGLALAADQVVVISGFKFGSPSVTVNVGDSVTWRNNDTTAHTATADDGGFDTGTIAAGDTAEVTFDTAGTYAYHCKIHAQMTATVVVEAAASGGGGGGGTTVTPAPTDTMPAEPIHHDGPWTAIALLLAVLGASMLVGTWLLGRRSSVEADAD